MSGVSALNSKIDPYTGEAAIYTTETFLPFDFQAALESANGSPIRKRLKRGSEVGGQGPESGFISHFLFSIFSISHFPFCPLCNLCVLRDSVVQVRKTLPQSH